MGDVEGYRWIGGFVGQMDNFGSISNSYSTGNANGVYDVGGFAGAASPGTVENSFYIGTANVPGSLEGFQVTSNILKQINTFKTAGGYVSADWVITSSPDPSSIWYVDEDYDYPKFYWSYHPVPPKNNSGGSGTGGATVVNNTPAQSAPALDNTTQSITHAPDNNTPQNITPKPEPPKKTLSLIGLIVMLTMVLIAMTQIYKAAKLNSKGIENPNLIYQIIIALAAIVAVIVFFMMNNLGGEIILFGTGGIITCLLLLVQLILLAKFYLLKKNKK